MNIDKPGSYRNARRRDGDLKHKKHLRELNGHRIRRGVIEKTSAKGEQYRVRRYRSQKYSAFLKREAARAQRRAKDLPDGSGYKKAYEYWWNLL